ncbi:D-2-hydroxyacid dehydrogenase [Botrimarina hoheduenensis]|uniref:Glycerate dehydrogenase n=1 Tax=Botrimarina hoheduenensis TaxID=2528000 RepID=A0A5C5VYC3_9BACT|nr:D-2-hydroxyacid dehydrogenase [Botrimarina hoheduenensis]TWT42953.1 Glycerate dehydrogenase [Botrimarina hoheduenensis]
MATSSITRPRIVLCYPVESRHFARIEQQLSDIGIDAELIDAGQQHIADELLQADIYCGHAKVPVPWPEVVAQGRLQWIQSSAAGMDHCLTPEVVASDIVVTSASGVLADQVAEQTFALLFGLLRSLPVFFRAQQAHEFVRLPTRDLHRARVGIVGFGGNGRRLAEVLAPFRCELIATDLFPHDKPETVSQLLPAEALDGLLPTLDVLILTAPLTDQTCGMFDADRLARLPSHALLINVARGAIVQEKALVEALAAGRLAGAGVDVTEIEPLDPASPLWDLPNVIITPHVGGQAATRIDDMTEFFCTNLRRFFSRQPLRNLVDKTLGFPRPEDAAWRIPGGQ